MMASSKQPTGSPVVKLEIYDVEKVRGMSKFYLYLIQATCKDGSRYNIRRRYRQFDEVYNSLEKRFPIEAGFIKAKERILPDLPGKVIFGRSAVKDLAEKRLPALNSYLKKLMSLSDKIRYDSIVLAFTKPTPEDLTISPSNGHAKSGKPERPAPPSKPALPTIKPARPPPAASRKVPPPRPMAPVSKTSTTEPTAKALYSYTAQFADELSFVEGRTITGITRVNAEWWEGHLDGRKGLVPSNYIQVTECSARKSSKDTAQSSDEWDSSDDETERGKVTYYFNGAARTVDVSMATVKFPTLSALSQAIKKHLHREDVVLNFKDYSGDLVEMADSDDIELMKSEGIPPRKKSGANHAHWAVYVTQRNDHTPYRRHSQQTS
ncbi:neutrophil cytosol factor 4-like [Halichondria panicea]|uniref:neutrophil cytosol factor 4-like n=1 Tax=Halichondria panicea TaxID=6063 RepID=UPI00312B7C6D